MKCTRASREKQKEACCTGELVDNGLKYTLRPAWSENENWVLNQGPKTVQQIEIIQPLVGNQILWNSWFQWQEVPMVQLYQQYLCENCQEQLSLRQPAWKQPQATKTWTGIWPLWGSEKHRNDQFKIEQFKELDKYMGAWLISGHFFKSQAVHSGQV